MGRAGMEPSRLGAANACRVVVSPLPGSPAAARRTRSVGRFVETEHPDDRHILVVGRVDHDGAAWILRVGGAHHDGGIRGSGNRLPERQRQDRQCRDRAPEGPSGTPPSPRSRERQRLGAPRVLDPADDPRPEARPIGSGRARAQAPLKQGANAAKRLSLALTGAASAQMAGRGPGGPVLQSAIEVGPDPATGAKTGQHDDWTGLAATRILMAG
jgi:hypothetical protein